jgi:hypothetical protein
MPMACDGFDTPADTQQCAITTTELGHPGAATTPALQERAQFSQALDKFREVLSNPHAPGHNAALQHLGEGAVTTGWALSALGLQSTVPFLDHVGRSGAMVPSMFVPATHGIDRMFTSHPQLPSRMAELLCSSRSTT